MVEVFKTDVKSRYAAKNILNELNKVFPGYRINFDLEDCDKILRVETSQSSRPDLEKIKNLMSAKGFLCVRL